MDGQLNNTVSLRQSLNSAGIPIALICIVTALWIASEKYYLCARSAGPHFCFLSILDGAVFLGIDEGLPKSRGATFSIEKLSPDALDFYQFLAQQNHLPFGLAGRAFLPYSPGSTDRWGFIRLPIYLLYALPLIAASLRLARTQRPTGFPIDALKRGL